MNPKKSEEPPEPSDKIRAEDATMNIVEKSQTKDKKKDSGPSSTKQPLESAATPDQEKTEVSATKHITTAPGGKSASTPTQEKIKASAKRIGELSASGLKQEKNEASAAKDITNVLNELSTPTSNQKKIRASDKKDIMASSKRSRNDGNKYKTSIPGPSNMKRAVNKSDPIEFPDETKPDHLTTEAAITEQDNPTTNNDETNQLWLVRDYLLNFANYLYSTLSARLNQLSQNTPSETEGKIKNTKAPGKGFGKSPKQGTLSLKPSPSNALNTDVKCQCNTDSPMSNTCSICRTQCSQDKQTDKGKSVTNRSYNYMTQFYKKILEFVHLNCNVTSYPCECDIKRILFFFSLIIILGLAHLAHSAQVSL